MATEISLFDLKILIVEDKVTNAEYLSEILTGKGRADRRKLVFAATTEGALEALEDHLPDIVLLDLQIPYTVGGEPKIVNSYPIVEKVELLNYRRNLEIKILVLSSSVEDKGMQKLIAGDTRLITKFLDKAHYYKTEELHKELIELIGRTSKEKSEVKTVSYDTIRRTVLKDLKNLNEPLWLKIDTFIITPFEGLFKPKANIEPVAKQIIGSCGEVVEDIINFMKHDHYELTNDNYLNNERSIRNSLNALTGRKHIQKNEFEYHPENQMISRPAAEYAYMAYRLRSEALHTKEDDVYNSKLFINVKFKIEDAAVSINLISPLIRNYITYIRKKKFSSPTNFR